METGALDRPWAVKLPRTSSATLAGLRLMAGLQISADNDALWLRGERLNETLSRRLLALPASARCSIGDDGVLTPWGKMTPTGTLPRGDWQSLRAWGELALPALGWPAARPAGVTLTLIRDAAERPCGALLTPWETWRSFVVTAPQIRLDGLAFVLNAQRQVIVRGASLPSIPGVRLIDDLGIMALAGWHWRPAVDAQTVRESFGLGDGECAYWPSGDQWQRIPVGAWVSAARSAVRATAREAWHG